MNEIEPIYGFPLFTKEKAAGYIVKHNNCEYLIFGHFGTIS